MQIIISAGASTASSTALEPRSDHAAWQQWPAWQHRARHAPLPISRR